jgi:hypothetical protein
VQDRASSYTCTVPHDSESRRPDRDPTYRPSFTAAEYWRMMPSTGLCVSGPVALHQDPVSAGVCPCTV